MFGLHMEALHAIDQTLALFDESGLSLTITSARDGTHGAHSHHYKGMAFDIRIWDIADEVHDWAEKIREKLGGNYQVIVERDHIHIEFDPVHA